MSLLDAADPTLLINSLANPLAPDARPAFRAAAEQALAGLSCWVKASATGPLPRCRNYFSLRRMMRGCIGTLASISVPADGPSSSTPRRLDLGVVGICITRVAQKQRAERWLTGPSAA
jgi:hypothetical protein